MAEDKAIRAELAAIVGGLADEKLAALAKEMVESEDGEGEKREGYSRVQQLRIRCEDELGEDIRTSEIVLVIWKEVASRWGFSLQKR